MAPEYFKFEQRLATFKTAKNYDWPHTSPTSTICPDALARAGFYFKPVKSGQDRTICFLCSRTLGGWEEGDDPVAEHLRGDGSDCSWARCRELEAKWKDRTGDEVEEWTDENLPSGEIMEKCRLETFRKWWPHDGKKGWKVTSKALAEAGFYFNNCPDKDDNADKEEDAATCPYCLTCLANWEPNDDPMLEHKKRKQDCVFFTAKSNSKAPATSTPDESFLFVDAHEVPQKEPDPIKNKSKAASKLKKGTKKVESESQASTIGEEDSSRARPARTRKGQKTEPVSEPSEPQSQARSLTRSTSGREVAERLLPKSASQSSIEASSKPLPPIPSDGIVEVAESGVKLLRISKDSEPKKPPARGRSRATQSNAVVVESQPESATVGPIVEVEEDQAEMEVDIPAVGPPTRRTRAASILVSSSTVTGKKAASKAPSKAHNAAITAPTESVIDPSEKSEDVMEVDLPVVAPRRTRAGSVSVSTTATAKKATTTAAIGKPTTKAKGKEKTKAGATAGKDAKESADKGEEDIDIDMDRDADADVVEEVKVEKAKDGLGMLLDNDPFVDNDKTSTGLRNASQASRPTIPLPRSTTTSSVATNFTTSTTTSALSGYANSSVGPSTIMSASDSALSISSLQSVQTTLEELTEEERKMTLLQWYDYLAEKEHDKVKKQMQKMRDDLQKRFDEGRKELLLMREKVKRKEDEGKRGDKMGDGMVGVEVFGVEDAEVEVEGEQEQGHGETTVDKKKDKKGKTKKAKEPAGLANTRSTRNRIR